MEEKKSGKSAPFIATFIAFAAVLFILRIVITANFVEEGTGFYTGGAALVYAFNILCVLFVIASFVLVGIKAKDKKVNLRSSGKTMGILSVIAGIEFVVEGSSALVAFFRSESYKHFTSLFGSQRYDVSDIASEIAQGYILFFIGVFGILSSVFFIKVTQVCEGKGDYSKNVLLSICPVWFGVLKAVYILLIPIDLKRVSDLLYEIIALAFLILFFSAFARVAVHREEKSTHPRVIAYAMCYFLFIGLTAVSGVVELIKGGSVRSSYFQTGVEFDVKTVFTYLACAIFTAALVIYTVRRDSSDENTSSELASAETESDTNAEETDKADE